MTSEFLNCLKKSFIVVSENIIPIYLKGAKAFKFKGDDSGEVLYLTYVLTFTNGKAVSGYFDSLKSLINALNKQDEQLIAQGMMGMLGFFPEELKYISKLNSF